MNTAFKKRWFTLSKDSFLRYYKRRRSRQRGRIDLAGARIHSPHALATGKDSYGHRLHVAPQSTERVFVMLATNER